MPTKKSSPAQNANKPTKASVKPTPNKTSSKPAKKTPTRKVALSWKPAGPIPKTDAERSLNFREQAFVREYLIDLNATQAAIRAGYSEKTAGSQAHELLKKPEISLEIQKAMAERSKRTEISADRALQEAWAILTADARELIEFIVGCCRHCYGAGFKFQRTSGEYNAAYAKWSEESKNGKTAEDFDEMGGIGFDPRKEPNPECPECFGKGYGHAHINDTRKLSPSAVALYAGVKQTKQGLEVKMHSKLDAMEKVFKHLGLFEKDNNQKVDPIAALLAAMGKSSIPVVKNPDGDAT